MVTMARVFMSGRSQAVCIPKAFRFKGNRVAISRRGSTVVLTPLPDNTWEAFFSDHVCPDFELDRTEAQRMPERTPFE